MGAGRAGCMYQNWSIILVTLIHCENLPALASTVLKKPTVSKANLASLKASITAIMRKVFLEKIRGSLVRSEERSS